MKKEKKLPAPKKVTEPVIEKAVQARKVQKTETDAASNDEQASFFQNVWEVVKLIPKGRVTSYGAIAGYLGSRMGARMVGWAMIGSHSAPFHVPAQRVVNRNGMLTGKHHFGEPDAMQKLLEKDGVKVENDTVVDFEKRFWDPAKELTL